MLKVREDIKAIESIVNEAKEIIESTKETATFEEVIEILHCLDGEKIEYSEISGALEISASAIYKWRQPKEWVSLYRYIKHFKPQYLESFHQFLELKVTQRREVIRDSFSINPQLKVSA